MPDRHDYFRDDRGRGRQLDYYHDDRGYDRRHDYYYDDPGYERRSDGYGDDPGHPRHQQGYYPEPTDHDWQPEFREHQYDTDPRYDRRYAEPDGHEELQFFRDDPAPRRHRRNDTGGGGTGRSAGTLLLTFVILGALVLGGWFGFTKVRDFLTPPDYDGEGSGKVTVVVKTGDTAGAIGNELYRKDVVASAAAFVNAAEGDERSRGIQPGAYQ